MSCLTLITQRASCLARSLTGNSDGRSSRSGRHESAARWRCLQNTWYKVTTVLSQRRDVGRYYFRTPSAVMEQSPRVHYFLYFMLLKKKTTGCPKRRHTKILNNVIFIYFQILLVTVGNTVVYTTSYVHQFM